MDRLVAYAIAYYNDFVKPTKCYRHAARADIVALTDLRDSSSMFPVVRRVRNSSKLFMMYKRHTATYPGLKTVRRSTRFCLGRSRGLMKFLPYTVLTVDRSPCRVISGEALDT